MMNLIHAHLDYQKDPTNHFNDKVFFNDSHINVYLHYFIYSVHN